MSFQGDMKLQWGALDDGGAAKVKEAFCYICSCQSSTIHVPQDKMLCNLCKDKPDNVNEHCYHYPFLADPEAKQVLEDELAVLTSIVDMELLANQDNDGHDGTYQRMYVRRTGEVMILGDRYDIDYQPSTANDKIIFSGHITDELGRRSMSHAGTLQDRRQRLREQLVNEQRRREIVRMMAKSEPKENAMYLVLQAVVCILHLENRVGLKSIESILRSGLSNAKKGILEWQQSSGEQKCKEEYVHHITDILQTKILGSAVSPSQWYFPLNEEGDMGTLLMDNNRTRLVMNSIELIVEASFPDADQNKARLLHCFPHYQAAIVILRKDSDYTDGEITAFQEHIDTWFRDWVNVYGKEGCTNYTHMLSSSHVMRYMQEWRCLHRYSQQGWEALNALVKSYFFRRTNRGGYSAIGAKKSKLLAIARWMQRRMMWYSGHGDLLLAADNKDDSEYDDGSGGMTSDDELDDDMFQSEYSEDYSEQDSDDNES
jgi:hypothetical protein